MLKYIIGLLSVFTFGINQVDASKSKALTILPGYLLSSNSVSNNCKTFSIGPGTGCAWMCNYCQTQLGTTNYYFTDGVCTYQSGGCVGNPQAGGSYTCCSN
jgi:hypothetical protein